MKPDFPGIPDGYAVACQAFAEGVRPPPPVNVWQWADAERWLPAEGSAERGRWKTGRVPYARRIMWALSPECPARRVVFMASRQVAKTEIGLNFVGRHIRHGRGAIMCTQPTLSPLAERFSKSRLGPMIEGCPGLLAKVGPQKSRDGSNTLFLKAFPGGLVVVSGANSAASLRQLPFGHLFADEIDEYERDIEDQGDVLDILEGAMTTFPFRKLYLCSTPTIESLSRINKEYQAGTAEEYHVPCPHCQGLQALVWEQLHWPEGRPHEAHYLCVHCGKPIEHWRKETLLPEEGYGGSARWVARHPERPVPSFHLNGLYAPIGLGLTWGELAEKYEQAKADPVKLKTFQNIRLGITSKDPGERFDPEELMARAGGYGRGRLPPGFLFLSGGVDVQKNRVAMTKVGHGRHRALAVADYIEVMVDPTDPVALAQAIDDWMAEPVPNCHGIPLRVEAYAVDCGYLTDDVLFYARSRRDRCIAVKGASQYGKPVIAAKPSAVEFNWPSNSTVRYAGESWQIGTDTFKDHLFARLGSDREKAPEERMVRFPGVFDPGPPASVRDGLDESYFVMLTAWIYDPNRGRWLKQRADEALATLTYAVAAAMQPRWRVHQRPESWWAQREAKLEPPVSLDGRDGPPAKPKPSGPQSLADIIRGRMGGV